MRLIPVDPAGRAAALSFASNLVLMGLKLSVGLIGGSVAVLSDGLDSLQDSVAAGIAYVSVSIGRRPPDPEHPYGHGRAETIAASVQALLIAAGGAFVLYRSLDRYFEPPEHIGTLSGIAVMLFAAVVNLGVASYARRIALSTGSPAIAADARHLMTNVVQAVAVLLGLAIIALTGEVRIDAVLAFGLGAYLLWIAATIMWTSVGEFLDRSLSEDELNFVEQAIMAERARVVGFHRLRARRSGQTRHMEVHLVLDPELTVAAAHEITDRIEARVASHWPRTSVTIHTEPADGRFLGPMQGKGARGREGEQPPGQRR
jgi:cation diffusion facilitator family transporter